MGASSGLWKVGLQTTIGYGRNGFDRRRKAGAGAQLWRGKRYGRKPRWGDPCPQGQSRTTRRVKGPHHFQKKGEAHGFQMREKHETNL